MMTTMTIRLTQGAREHLQAYLTDVRRALVGSSDVDPSEVEEGIREHVETLLAERGVGPDGPATVEDVADAIERLGSPEAWRAEGAVGPSVEKEPTTTAERESRVRLLALAFVTIGMGVALAFTARWAGLGWLLLVGGSLSLRFLAPVEIDDPKISPLEGLATRWWIVFATAAGLALLIGPGLLAWGAAQIGGVLEPTLEARVGAAGGERSPAYWFATGAVGAFVTGAWWILLGLIAVRFRAGIRRALGAADGLLRPGASRALVLSGAVLVVLSLGGLLL